MSPSDYTWEVREYQTPDGGYPFSQWLNRLRDGRLRARIAVRLNRLRLGNFGDAKPVGDGVMELRIHAGAGIRIYFGRIGSRLVLLSTGGDKSSQRRDIEQAKRYWRAYRSERDGNQTL